LRAQKIGFNVLEPDGETPLHKDPFDVTVFKLLGRGVGSVTDPPNGGITILETEPGDMFRLYGQRWSWWRARHGFTNRQPDEMRVGTYFPDPKR